MRFSEIAEILGGNIEAQGANDDISELVIDSRQATSHPNTLFFCLRGVYHDGHQFIPQLVEKGIRNFIVSDAQISDDLNLIQVADTLGALQKLVAHHRSSFHIPVIGITGSNGKTMIKEWLSTVLSEKYKVVKSPKSYNSQVGVPLSVWQMKREHEIGVFEAGISQKGEMEKLEKIIRPTIGIFTNIGEAHSEGFESLNEKIEEKSRLFTNADKLICSKDQPEIYDYLKKAFGDKVIAWSAHESSEITIVKEPLRHLFKYGNEVYAFKLGEKADRDLENLFHVISAAIVCGMSQQEIEDGIKHIVPVPMRLELKRGINDTYILDDTYNNDLAGLRIALDYLQQQTQYSRKTVILSDILQSGLQDLQLYGEVNTQLKLHGVDRVIGIGQAITASGDLFGMETFFFPDAEAFLASDLTFAHEMILVKGARVFGLEKIVSFLEEKNHGTVLEVNFEALIHNLNSYRNLLRKDVRLMVMVKAFAYGGGIAEIANLLQYQQVDRLGVAYVDEGIFLRKHGIKIPILVMNPNWEALSLLTSFNLEAEVYSLAMLRHMLTTLKQLPGIHLKLETGMNRLGIPHEDIEELKTLLAQHPELKIKGVFTHLSSQEEDSNDDYTLSQIRLFEQSSEEIASTLGYQPIRHVLNSAGIVRWPDYQYEMVRLGIGLYGFDATGKMQNLQPISTLKTIISQVKKVKKGDSIGYSRMGKAQKDGQIAILPIGYADGYLRVFGNGKAWVSVQGKKAPTIGNICMDMTMIDVSGIEVKEGDEVTLFGQEPTIVELAKWVDTIPYEILTNVSQRVKRVFRSE
ncbi:MAG: bifunctional UDP-N-acetylmuramoyl-tripeptide:D-alanyl-D-alanine ligase/alanine racemase [Cyclobacteriaceae bacterium]